MSPGGSTTDPRGLNWLRYAGAARDGVPLYERAPGEFARFVSLATRRFADTEKFRRAQQALLRP